MTLLQGLASPLVQVGPELLLVPTHQVHLERPLFLQPQDTFPGRLEGAPTRASTRGRITTDAYGSGTSPGFMLR